MSSDRDKDPIDEAAKLRAENRAKLVASAIRRAKLTGRSVEALSAAGVQKVMPLLRAYVGPQRFGDDEDEQLVDPATGKPIEPVAGRLSRDEKRVLNAVATKVFIELLEITSRTDPIYTDAPVYTAYQDGVLRTPHLAHILSLGVAANRVLGSRGQTEPPPGEEPGGAVTEKSVAYLAVAPGEYVEDPGPLSPSVIRRSAMRERSYNPPALAMMARQSNQFPIAAANKGQSSAAMGVGAYAYSGAGAAYGRGAAASPARGCGGCPSCGGRSGGCRTCGGGGYGRYAFSPPRRKEDGSCESFGKISCETTWRVRECLKWAVCDLIRCVGEELCDEDGQFVSNPRIGDCLERFVCSIVTCLPEAICPPPEREEVCCLPAIDCDCNFAVGD